MRDLDSFIYPSSFDNQKVIVDRINGMVCKKSSDLEYRSITYLSGYLRNINITTNFVKIKVVEILEYSYDTNRLITKFEDGINLEIAINHGLLTRNEIIFLFKEVFLFFKNIGLIQLDFAPRNIIYNKSTNTIILLDFERGILDTNQINNDELNFLLTFGILEELSAFLTDYEVLEIIGNIFCLDVNNIRGDILNNFPIGKRRKGIIDNILRKKINRGSNDVINYYIFINYFFAKFIQQQFEGERMIYKLEELSLEEIQEKIILFIKETRNK